MPSENPFGRLTQTHGYILTRMDLLHDALLGLRLRRPWLSDPPLETLRETSRFLDRVARPHMREEEEVVFPYLETHIPKLQGPLSILKMEHEDFRRRHEDLKAVLGQTEDPPRTLEDGVLGRLEELGTYVVVLLRNHIRQEQDIVFRQAGELLKADEKESLRGQLEIGGVCCESL